MTKILAKAVFGMCNPSYLQVITEIKTLETMSVRRVTVVLFGRHSKNATM